MRFFTDLRYKRSWMGAIGFYVLFIVVNVLISKIIEIMLGAVQPTFLPPRIISMIGGISLAIVLSAALAYGICRAKGVRNNQSFLIVGATILLATIGGVITGLWIPAYLTVLHPRKTKR